MKPPSSNVDNTLNVVIYFIDVISEIGVGKNLL